MAALVLFLLTGDPQTNAYRIMKTKANVMKFHQKEAKRFPKGYMLEKNGNFPLTNKKKIHQLVNIWSVIAKKRPDASDLFT